MDDALATQLPSELLALTSLIDERTETLASGSKDIQAAALNATKFIFDLALASESNSIPPILDLLSSLSPSEAPRTRSQARANGKRKQSPSPPPLPKFQLEPTPLTSLFIDGMDEEQIWGQLELRGKNFCKTLEEALEGTGKEEEDNEQEGQLLKKAMMNQLNEEDLKGIDMDALMEEMQAYEDDDDSKDDSEEDEVDEEEEDDRRFSDLEEAVEELRDPTSDEEDDDDDAILEPSSHLDGLSPKRIPAARKRKSSELDDDFFDLASFNAETERAEARSVSKGRLANDASDSEDDEEGSVDLFAPVDVFDNFDEEDLENNAGESYYKDFFEPPPRNPVSKRKIKPSDVPPSKKSGQVRFHDEVRVKTIKAKGKGIPVGTADLLYVGDVDEDEDGFGEEVTFDDDEEEEERQKGDEDVVDFGSTGENQSEHEAGGLETIQRLKDDLFAEDQTPDDQDLSTHERRMLSLREQIASLEAENVGRKDWTLMGEASSRARPQNSLLEEDLEFERVMKSVPVITDEVVLGLEEVIKARIMEGRFDDVVRLRPLDDKPFLPSRFFELQDQKSKQSLAQIYEDEYTAARTGGVAGEDRDGKLKMEHDEIEKLWEGICGKLDALCNAHFVPKQPKAIISTVANVTAANLESALPTTKSASTILAPEEVFVPDSSDPRARSELTPTEKRALRNKEKKAKKKTRDSLNTGVDKYAKINGIGGVKRQKRAALESVVKSGRGVTIVGKKSKDVARKNRPVGR